MECSKDTLRIANVVDTVGVSRCFVVASPMKWKPIGYFGREILVEIHQPQPFELSYELLRSGMLELDPVGFATVAEPGPAKLRKLGLYDIAQAEFRPYKVRQGGYYAGVGVAFESQNHVPPLAGTHRVEPPCLLEQRHSIAYGGTKFAV